MPRDLSGHRLIDFLLAEPGERLEWEFEEGGQVTAWRPHATTAVGDANARVDLAIAGLGVVQTLCFIAAPALRDRRLERLLPQWETDAPAISILYPRDRHLPARTRATMDVFAEWITQALEDARPAPT
jgi:LysR family transcriptional regulator for bpeEF and oprC